MEKSSIFQTFPEKAENHRIFQSFQVRINPVVHANILYTTNNTPFLGHTSPRLQLWAPYTVTNPQINVNIIYIVVNGKNVCIFSYIYIYTFLRANLNVL